MVMGDLGRDVDVVAAGTAIDLGDAPRVGLNHRARERAARLGLNFGRKLLVLDLLIALESDPANHGIFDHRDDDAAAGPADPYILEQARLDQGLQAVIDSAGVERAVRTGLEIGADGVGLNATVALDRDQFGLLGRRRR